MYNLIVLTYAYTYESITIIKLVKHIHHLISYVCVCVVRTFKIYCLRNLQAHTTVLLTSHHADHYILRLYLFYNWKFVPLNTFTHFLQLLCPAFGNHQSTVSMSSFFLASTYKLYAAFLFCLFHLA